MRQSTRILIRLYGFLLKLYPRAVRAEYGEELLAVFCLMADEAAEQGGASMIGLSLRELRDLPGAALLEHWQERRKLAMATERGSRFAFEPGSWREALAAVAPFVLLGAFPAAINALHLPAMVARWPGAVILISTLVLLLGVFVIGVIKGFPRWFMPYLGLPVSVFSAYVFFDMTRGLRRALVAPTASWLTGQIAYQGQLWVGVLATGLLVVLLARAVPPLHALYRRLRRDYSLLPFSLYGATLLGLFITFDDYVGEEPYLIASTLLLAAGGWWYLRSAGPRQRLLTLLLALTSAMAVAAAGKAILYSSPDWPYPRHFTWQTEAMSTVIMCGWLALGIMAPGLLALLRHPDGQADAK